MTRRLLLIIALLFVLAPTGCRQSTQPTSGLPTCQMQIGSKTFTLEIASTEESRERGLMRRDSMPDDHGMIFVFTGASKMAFWMKNTRIPLDIIYVAEDGKVDCVKQMQPYSETNVPSEGSVKWAIELNQGMGAKVGVKAGDVLSIPESARNAKE